MEKEEWIYRALQGHKIIFPEDLLNKVTTMTHGADVAKGIFNLIGKKDAIGEAFHITTEQSCTWADIIKIYNKGLRESIGKELQIQFVSSDEFLKCRNEQLKWQYLYDRLYDREFDISKGQKIIDEEDFENVENGLKECLVQFIERGAHFKAVNYQYEAIKDKLTHEKLKLIASTNLKQKIQYLLYRYIL